MLDCLDPITRNRAVNALVVRADGYNNATMCPEGPNQQFPMKNFVLRGSLEVRQPTAPSQSIFHNVLQAQCSVRYATRLP